MGWLTGLEPATTGITIRDSTSWATATIWKTTIHSGLETQSKLFQKHSGVPDRNRTCNPQLRRLVLYPVELRAPLKPGLPRINWAWLVGVERFELPTSWSQTRRATRLRYTPEGRNYTFPLIKGQFSCLFRPIFPTWKESENQGNIWKTNKEVRYLNSKIFIQNHFGVRKCFCTLLVFVLRKPQHIIMLDYPKLNACPPVIQL